MIIKLRVMTKKWKLHARFLRSLNLLLISLSNSSLSSITFLSYNSQGEIVSLLLKFFFAVSLPLFFFEKIFAPTL